jgi:hypothetical protein
MAVKTNLQEVNMILWDLQKQQCVKFNEQHTQNGSYLSRIRLLPKGRAMIVAKRGTPQNAVLRVNSKTPKETGMSAQTRRGAVHAVGIDKTYYRNHRKVAEGGPIEVIHPATHEPQIIPAVPYTAPIEQPVRTPDPLPQNRKALFTDESGAAHIVPDPILAEVPAAPELKFADFPLLVDLVGKRNHKAEMREKAAKFVEAASLISDIDPNEADHLMSLAGEMEGPSLTKLELEVLRLIDAIPGLVASA